jgi:hypothetical protein
VFTPLRYRPTVAPPLDPRTTGRLLAALLVAASVLFWIDVRLGLGVVVGLGGVLALGARWPLPLRIAVAGALLVGGGALLGPAAVIAAIGVPLAIAVVIAAIILVRRGRLLRELEDALVERRPLGPLVARLSAERTAIGKAVHLLVACGHPHEALDLLARTRRRDHGWPLIGLRAEAWLDLGELEMARRVLAVAVPPRRRGDRDRVERLRARLAIADGRAEEMARRYAGARPAEDALIEADARAALGDSAGARRVLEALCQRDDRGVVWCELARRKRRPCAALAGAVAEAWVRRPG